MPTACTLDSLEITAARPEDPRSNYFAARRLNSLVVEAFRRNGGGQRKKNGTTPTLPEESTIAEDQKLIMIDEENVVVSVTTNSDEELLGSRLSYEEDSDSISRKIPMRNCPRKIATPFNTDCAQVD